MSTSLKHLELGGIRWAYREQGQGPLVLMSHGTFLDHSLWDTLAEALSDRFRCVQLDLPGHGQSGFWPQGWGVADLVRLYPQLIAALGETQATLVGLSIGGAISLRVAAEHPECVNALVYMDAAVDAPGPAHLDNLKALAQQLGSLSDEKERAALFTAESFQRLMHTPGWRDQNPQLAAHELQVQLSHPRAAYPLLAGVVASLNPMSQRLSEVRCPVLALWGADDPGAIWNDVISNGLPSVSLHLVPNAGHHLPYDQPQQCVDLVSAFLDGIVKNS